MKHFYFLIFIAILGLNKVSAETCPYAGTTSAGGTQIIFSYTPATSFCVNRPETIVVNGTTTFSLNVGSCSETISVYNISAGPPIVGQNFSVTSGFDASCSYNEGTLPVNDFEILKEQFKIIPNPLVSGNEIKLEFGLNMPLKIEVYSVTGKLMLKTNTNNESFKIINSDHFPNGLYMVKIASEKASVTRKLMVMK